MKVRFLRIQLLESVVPRTLLLEDDRVPPRKVPPTFTKGTLQWRRGLHLQRSTLWRYPSRRLEGSFEGFKGVHLWKGGAWRELEGGFKGAWRGLQGGLKPSEGEGGFEGLEGGLKGAFPSEGFKGAWRGLQGGLKGASPARALGISEDHISEDCFVSKNLADQLQPLRHNCKTHIDTPILHCSKGV